MSAVLDRGEPMQLAGKVLPPEGVVVTAGYHGKTSGDLVP
jgi:hypothetical protein